MVKMIMCSTLGTVYCTTHTQKSEHFTWLLGAMKSVSMLCKLWRFHAVSRRLPFLKPQHHRQGINAAGLSIVFEGFAYLFSLVLWTHWHGPHAVYIFASINQTKDRLCFKMMYYYVTTGDIGYLHTTDTQYWTFGLVINKTKGNENMSLKISPQN